MDRCTLSTRLWCIAIYISFHCLYSAHCETRVIATAPVSPVNEGELLSIHCQVWDLNPNHEVSIHRQLNHRSKRLTVNEDVMSNVDDRVFVAPRMFGDGSAVYFLTITNVMRQDSGEYSCKVVDPGEVQKVAESNINITVNYFPSEVYPICGKLNQQEWLEGITISLNCSSEAGSPPVKIQWKHSSEGALPGAIQTINGAVTYSELQLRLSRKHNGALFLCEVRSKPFGNRLSSCHIGPITVLPNRGGNNKLETPPMNGNKKPDTTEAETLPKLPVTTKQECLKNCSPYNSSSVLFWVIATVASVIVAVIFFLMGVTLIFKYMKMKQRTTFIAHRAGEDIYAEVESKAENRSRVYMSLQRPDNRNFCIVSPTPTHEYNKDYHEAPTIAKL